MSQLRIPVPISGGLILSYKCTARCRHCMYACSSAWKGDWISEERLRRGLSQLARVIEPSPWGRDNVSLSHGLHFSGGEPFMNFQLLARAVAIAEELGIPSTFVETNCSWCTDDAVTQEKLENLQQKGLKGILVSVNPFYAEFVPFERTERCIEVSAQIFGDNLFVYQLEFYRQFKRLGIRGTVSLPDYFRMTGGTQTLTKRVELFLMGRAAHSLRKLFRTHPARSFFRAPCQPPFLRSWHNHFDNYGHFMPGFCGGISLGNWLDLSDLLRDGLDLEKRPILKFLSDDNMEGLYRFAVDRGYPQRENGYVSKCDLCLDIRSFLVAIDDFPELRPRQFYHQLEDESL